VACVVTAVALALLAGTCAAVAHAPGLEPTEERRFWVKDKHHYRSPWYRGTHRRMINFGCTRAPYYPPDPRCVADRGFHHGVDIAMGCGTLLRSALRGRVVQPRSAGALGPVVHQRRTAFDFGGSSYRQSEEYFLLRADVFDAAPTVPSELELVAVLGTRWWTREELRSTQERVYPEELVEVLERLGA